MLTILVAGAAVLIGALSAIGWLIDSVLDREIEGGFDRPIAEEVVGWRTAVLDDVMSTATHLGGTAFVATALAIAALASLVLLRGARWPWFFCVAAVGGLQLSGVVKHVVDRERPALAPLFDVASPAFPSGHAAASAACFLAVAYFLWETRGRAAGVLACIGAMALFVLVGFTRVYLGVHWPTDVVFGWLLGASWVFVAARATAVLRPQDRD